MHRRAFLAAASQSALFGRLGLAGIAGIAGPATQASVEAKSVSSTNHLTDATIAELARSLGQGRVTAASLCKAYLRRIHQIDRAGPRLNSVIELNPEATALAEALDAERRRRGSRGLLHGIPVLIKDNLDTHDRMTTTAGSLALAGSVAPRDSFVVERLRQTGAVILGKTNLSEWANFRGSRSISGWSGRGGQTRNPYCTVCSPSGSSSGSAAAVSAGLCAVAIGTETNGSIVSPASYCGIVGIKPTVGLVSRAGIIPISASQDTAGPMARTVADAAALLGAMTGIDSRDAATAASAGRAETDYTRFLDSSALRGARLGVPRALFKLHRNVDPIFEESLNALRRCGADLIENIQLPSRQELGGADYQVMVYEFKDGLNAYFKSLGPSARIQSVSDLIKFNDEHRERELELFGQETLIEANAKGSLEDTGYREAKERCRKWSASVAQLFVENRLDAIVAPTSGPAHVLDYIHGDHGLGGSSTFAAVAGLPHITVPCGYLRGLPMGLSFFGPAWSEGRLISLAHAFEQNTQARRAPHFVTTIDELK